VLVRDNGRPRAMPDLVGKASAILEAWLPGEEGAAAIAAVIFGDANPGGKLPITFPRHVGQIPLHYNQKPSGGRSNWYGDYVGVERSPLFPFGHGLSYTTFQVDDFHLSAAQAEAGGIVDVSVNVRNTGALAGDEVIQLYTCDEYACIPRPVKELKGFIRLTLQPGENRRVIFHLPVNQLAFYDETMQLMVEAGTIRVMVGTSSENICCEGAFEITGPQKKGIQERLFESPVELE
jgi:beta-glucosidase